MGLSRKPNRYGLDPFLCIDTAKANYYFGRTDVPPDTEEGQRQAALDAAKDVDPELDRTLPWTLLMCGVWKYLYKEAEREQNRFAGRKKRTEGHKKEFPKKIKIEPEDWAEAFNMVSVGFIDNGFLKKPDKVGEQKLANGRKVGLLVMVQDPGKGAAKTQDYLSTNRIHETRMRLQRIETHRGELATNPRVKKYLADLRTPAVN